IPIKDTLNIINASHEIPSNLISLIEHCLTTTYYNNQFYKKRNRTELRNFLIFLNNQHPNIHFSIHQVYRKQHTQIDTYMPSRTKTVCNQLTCT
ncbi:hypothetical protein ALC53_05109, partial [Atta colombica]